MIYEVLFLLPHSHRQLKQEFLPEMQYLGDSCYINLTLKMSALGN